MPWSQMNYDEVVVGCRCLFGEFRPGAVQSGGGRATTANTSHPAASIASHLTRSYNFFRHRRHHREGGGEFNRPGTVRCPPGQLTVAAGGQ